jgi:hypothetical protein
VVDACAPGNGKLRAGITVQGGVAVQRTFASAMIHATCVWFGAVDQHRSAQPQLLFHCPGMECESASL